MVPELLAWLEGVAGGSREMEKQPPNASTIPARGMSLSQRFVGIDLGTESIKVVELARGAQALEWVRHLFAEHHKEPVAALRTLLSEIDWEGVAGAAVTGRFGGKLTLARVPTKQAQAAGFRFLGKASAATVVSIGGHGFSVLELRPSGLEIFRENSRCSQGTGNFLRQLVERFDLSIDEASVMCETVPNAAPLSGRCPVILKTDMTHLANKGEDRARILAGLYDAVCENVQVLVKPGVSPGAVMLAGGVSRSARVRAHFAHFLATRGMQLIEATEEERLFLDALGAAVVAESQELAPPNLDSIFAVSEPAHFDVVPSLSDCLARVRRFRSAPSKIEPDPGRTLVLGFDIGSTGSKIVALDVATTEPVWEHYVDTNGNPVAAAQTLTQAFVRSGMAYGAVTACGVTGSGREIVGSLLATCYGVDRVYILNEIAAHAEGALHHDPRVDTIFEIGGQDAKYIRLAEGRVVDAAMNEACSAGTGSFVAEQGRKFSGIEGVAQLGATALASPCAVMLGQHCSVFMAEVIDAAVAAGVDNRAIIAGLYESVVQNYLNRVKGSRSIGQVIFCQGMPFSADALAAAVARQTGSEVIVPPNPGTVGALGIALLARKNLDIVARAPIEPRRFLDAQVTRKDTFVCKATRGCGGAGNCCRIDRIATVVEGTTGRFTWGGACSLWDKGTGRRKLPDQAPDPFREREETIARLVQLLSSPRGRPTVALTDEFQLKGLFPFFATFLHGLGFDLLIRRNADQKTLKRGIERANVPFCAPMQQFHGLMSSLAEEKPDHLFLPMIRSMPRSHCEPHGAVCPIVQGSTDIVRWDLGKANTSDILSPLIDVGDGNLDSRQFVDSCRQLASSLGISNGLWREAYAAALAAQRGFDQDCLAIGDRALAYCCEQKIVPIAVLGRPYTIHNKVLNSNVPALVREQGGMPIPVDCYPVDDRVPSFDEMYWGYGQRNLRAAHQIRRTPGVYSIWCSNYSCGPDSFNLHFYSYIMQGRPFAIIETDGHSGDAGTKTRVEAFLHCVRQDLDRGAHRSVPHDFATLSQNQPCAADVRARGETVLIPRMGPGADLLAAALATIGIPAESLPMPDRDAVQVGRRNTSGKECVPMCITLGSLLQRLERDRHTSARFAFLMPSTTGPCRFGLYHVLHRIVLERMGWKDRARVWSPLPEDYAEGLPSGLFALLMVGWVTLDILLAALYDVRPVEVCPGAAEAIYQRYRAELIERITAQASRRPTMARALMQVATGSLFGCVRLLARAARAYAAVKTGRQIPTVGVVGEIYVRCDPFANDFVIEKLEQRGMRAHFAPFNEWLEYADWCATQSCGENGPGAILTRAVRKRIQDLAYHMMGSRLGWHKRTTVKDTLAAAEPYLRAALQGEAVLTLGGPIHEWRSGVIDGAVSVGPLECMPSKLAEAQFFHVSEREGLPSLTISLNGDPMDSEVLDNFAFEVQQRFRERRKREAAVHTAA